MVDVIAKSPSDDALRNRLLRFEQWHRLACIGGWELDLTTHHLAWSEEIFRLFEIDPNAFGASYDAFLAAVHPDDRELVDSTYRRSVQTGEPYEIAHRLRMPDGRIKWVQERGRTFYDDAGAPIRSIGTVQDVTQRVELEARAGLREYLLSATPAATVLAALDGKIDLVNPAFLRLWRCIDPTEPMRRGVLDLWADRASAETMLRGVLVDGFWLGELVACRKDATQFIAQVAANTIPDAHGRPRGLLLHFLDVTARVEAERAVERQRLLLQNVINASPDPIYLKDAEFRVQLVNEAFSALVGRPIEALVGCPDTEIWSREACDGAPDAGVVGLRSIDRRVLAGETLRLPTEVASRIDGAIHVFDTLKQPLRDASGQVVGVLAYSHDITERVETERTLAQSEASLKLVFDHTSDHQMLIEIRADGLAIRSINATMRNALIARHRSGVGDAIGRDPDELLRELGIGSSGEVCTNALAAQRKAQQRFRADLPGMGLILDVWIIPVVDAEGVCTHVLWTARDITEAQRASDRLAAQLAEKELLLQEIHHRVKNNLQIVSSLLYLQERASESAKLGAALAESRGRIGAMALVHELLYSSGTPSNVDIGAYARALARSLVLTSGATAAGHRVEVEGDSFSLEIDSAIPCGLILNELVTNALKHAFPGGRRGTVTIALHEDESAHQLCVRDDGVGMPAELGDAGGLGLRLLPQLASQLEAELACTTGNGTTYTLRIPRRGAAR